MFKKIPGNDQYMIDLSMKIVSNDGVECTLPIINGKVVVSLYNETQVVDLKWLSLLAHFEVNLPEQFRNRLFDVQFTEFGNKLTKFNCGMVMTFRKPMVIGGKYRIVPNFTNYAVSKHGEVISICGRDVLLPYARPCRGGVGYPQVEVYHPDKTHARYVAVHRLVAHAWVKNDDWMAKTVCNHIDGNKLNPYYKNLEWVTVKENNSHAIRTGLRTDSVSCRVFDIVTQTEHSFPSITEAGAFMGFVGPLGRVRTTIKRAQKLLKERYEFRTHGDDRPWYYIGKTEPEHASRYIFNVVCPDGSTEKILGTRALIKRFKIYNTPTQGLHCIISLVRSRFPDHKVDIIDQHPIKPVQAYNLSNDEVIHSDTIFELSKQLGLNKSEILRKVRRSDYTPLKGYLFRYATDDPWDLTKAYNAVQPMCISASNPETKEIATFGSLRETAKHFGVDRSTVKIRLNSSKDIRGWFLQTTTINDSQACPK